MTLMKQDDTRRLLVYKSSIAAKYDPGDSSKGAERGQNSSYDTIRDGLSSPYLKQAGYLRRLKKIIHA
jgi:hypothetical protein